MYILLYISLPLSAKQQLLHSLVEPVGKILGVHGEAWTDKVFIDIKGTIKLRHHQPEDDHYPNVWPQREPDTSRIGK